MRKVSPRVRLLSLMATRPVLANRAVALVGSRRLTRIGRRNAIRAAQNAFARVPFYRKWYEAHGFDAARMRRLDWAGFLSLPTVSKAAAVEAGEEELLDSHQNMPA